MSDNGAAEPEKHVAITPPARDDHGRWRAGQSGNPKGRPRGPACLTDGLRKELAEVLPSGQTVAQDIAKTVIALARGGERWACELVWDRVEGRVGVEHHLTDAGARGPTLVTLRSHATGEVAHRFGYARTPEDIEALHRLADALDADDGIGDGPPDRPEAASCDREAATAAQC